MSTGAPHDPNPVPPRRDPISQSLRLDRPVVALGAFSGVALASAERAASESGLAFLHADANLPELGKIVPLAFVVPVGAAGPHPCVKIRVRKAFAHVPVIGLAEASDDLAFSEIFSVGGDDVVTASEPERLRVRLRTLARAQQGDPLPPGRRGLAIVAGTDASWRAVLGRVLLNGGYDVDFAVDAAAARRPEAKLVVTDEAFFKQAGRALLAARSGEAKQPWVVAVEPKQLSATRRELVEYSRVAVTDAFAPPENVLFLASELGFDVASRRESARLLYGTSIAFRVAGRERDEIGFSYNLSGGGIYVRTLAPLDPGQEAWIELWPPRSDRRVRLVGRVAWRRAYGPSETATVPPGFGVKLEGGLGDDLARYRSGYDTIVSAE